MAERKTLLQRYGIPLDHLDFQYIKTCNDAKEMERIVHVLQSGEEGYFPDLTKCAEEKLRELKPNSRLFRIEEQMLRREDVSATEIQPIYDFSKKVRDRDQSLAACSKSNDDLPPLREMGSIKLEAKEKKETSGSNVDVSSTGAAAAKETGTKSDTRIKSTDYRKWDEYDPDAEILRMDLEEERVQEEVERKNRLNATKSMPMPLITEIKEEEDRLKNLTDVERDTLAEEHRIRGNDYYRAKEYKEALKEYSRAVAINPKREAAAYNNRALTNIKLKNFQDALHDCEKCLSIEPNNVKAMYRLAESSMQMGLKEQALQMFSKVLELEPNNANATNFIEYLRQQIGEKPPANATRLLIEEAPKSSANIPSNKESKTNSKKKNSNSKDQRENSAKQTTTKSETVKDYDLAALVRPKELIPNKIVDTATNMFTHNKLLNTDTNTSNEKEIESRNTQKEKEFEIRLPVINNSSNIKRDKPLIEEI